jgi:hypothetical protein
MVVKIVLSLFFASLPLSGRTFDLETPHSKISRSCRPFFSSLVSLTVCSASSFLGDGSSLYSLVNNFLVFGQVPRNQWTQLFLINIMHRFVVSFPSPFGCTCLIAASAMGAFNVTDHLHAYDLSQG